MSKLTRAFKKRNPHLFESDSEGSDSDRSDSEEEYEENEVEAEEEIPTVENLNFELLLEEHKIVGRPSKLRGGRKSLPRAKTIPEEKFSNGTTLFEFVYGDKIFEEILIGTRECAAKLSPGGPPIELEDIKNFFGHLLIFSIFKAENDEIRDFLPRLRKDPSYSSCRQFKWHS